MEAIFGSLWIPCLICFIAGIVLLVTELCLPGFGLAGCTGIACFLSVIIMQFLTNSPTAATLVSVVMMDVRFAQEQCFVYADSVQIGQVLRNLIDNAIKAPAGSADEVGGLTCLAEKQRSFRNKRRG